MIRLPMIRLMYPPLHRPRQTTARSRTTPWFDTTQRQLVPSLERSITTLAAPEESEPSTADVLPGMLTFTAVMQAFSAVLLPVRTASDLPVIPTSSHDASENAAIAAESAILNVTSVSSSGLGGPPTRRGVSLGMHFIRPLSSPEGSDPHRLSTATA